MESLSKEALKNVILDCLLFQCSEDCVGYDLHIICKSLLFFCLWNVYFRRYSEFFLQVWPYGYHSTKGWCSI